MHVQRITQFMSPVSLFVLNYLICNLFSTTTHFMKCSLTSLLSTEVPQHDPNCAVAQSLLARARATISTAARVVALTLPLSSQPAGQAE